ncbi:MAG: hypothetical protein JNJ94_07580 [Chlorobi bacterium]|nr:hypothetical protein [Chlorobiota bacterium]
MRKFLFPFALAALALLASACSDTTSATTDELGKTTVEEVQANSAYAWFQVGYDAYPTSAGKAIFDSSVAKIKASFDPAKHSITMAVKLNCGCTETQNTFPQIMKTLDAAGIPRSNVSIYATDTRLNGIDSIKAAYNINVAPVYLVLKGGNVKGRIIKAPTTGKTVDQDLAEFFAVP